MAGKAPHRIIVAAVETMAAHATADIAMSDIAAVAGVSRSTLYRYFPTREALLEGIFDHALEGFQARLQAEIARRPAVGQRIDVCAEFLERELAEGMGRQLYGADVGLMLRLTNARQASVIAVFLVAMAPVFDAADAVARAPVDRDGVAQVFVRLYPSLMLLPDPQPVRRPAALFAWVLRGLLMAG